LIQISKFYCGIETIDLTSNPDNCIQPSVQITMSNVEHQIILKIDDNCRLVINRSMKALELLFHKYIIFIQ